MSFAVLARLVAHRSRQRSRIVLRLQQRTSSSAWDATSARKSGTYLDKASLTSPSKITRLLGKCRSHDEVIEIVNHAVASRLTDAVVVVSALHRLAALEKGKASKSSKCSVQLRAEEQLIDMLMKLMHKHIPEFGPREVANALWSFAVLRLSQPVLQDALAGRMCSYGSRASLRHWANVVWSAATLRWDEAQLFDAARESIRVSGHSCNGRDLSQFMWAFASGNRMGGCEILEHISLSRGRRLGQLSCQDMALIVWSSATLACRSVAATEFLCEIAVLAHDRIQEINSQGTSMLLWGYVKLTSNAPEVLSLLRALQHGVLRKSSEFSTQGAANVLWAFAAQACGPEDSHASVEALTGAVLRRGQDLAHCNAQDVANILWSLATLEHSGPISDAFVRAVSVSPLVPVDQFDAQNCANVLWASARARWSDTLGINGFEERVGFRALNLKDWDEQSLCSLLWALTMLKHQEIATIMLDSSTSWLLHGSTPRLEAFTLPGICSLVWVCSALQYRDKSLICALATATLEMLHEMPAERLIVISTAFASLWPRLKLNSKGAVEWEVWCLCE